MKNFFAQGFSEEGLVLMCKKTGTWTTKLYELARRAEYGEAGGYAHDVRVLIEGPYGMKNSSFHALFCFNFVGQVGLVI